MKLSLLTSVSAIALAMAVSSPSWAADDNTNNGTGIAQDDNNNNAYLGVAMDDDNQNATGLLNNSAGDDVNDVNASKGGQAAGDDIKNTEIEVKVKDNNTAKGSQIQQAGDDVKDNQNAKGIGNVQAQDDAINAQGLQNQASEDGDVEDNNNAKGDNNQQASDGGEIENVKQFGKANANKGGVAIGEINIDDIAVAVSTTKLKQVAINKAYFKAGGGESGKAYGGDVKDDVKAYGGDAKKAKAESEGGDAEKAKAESEGGDVEGNVEAKSDADAKAKAKAKGIGGDGGNGGNGSGNGGNGGASSGNGGAGGDNNDGGDGGDGDDGKAKAKAEATGGTSKSKAKANGGDADKAIAKNEGGDALAVAKGGDATSGDAYGGVNKVFTGDISNISMTQTQLSNINLNTGFNNNALGAVNVNVAVGSFNTGE